MIPRNNNTKFFFQSLSNVLYEQPRISHVPAQYDHYCSGTDSQQTISLGQSPPAGVPSVPVPTGLSRDSHALQLRLHKKKTINIKLRTALECISSRATTIPIITIIFIIRAIFMHRPAGKNQLTQRCRHIIATCCMPISWRFFFFLFVLFVFILL